MRTKFFTFIDPMRDGDLELLLCDCVDGSDEDPPAYLFEMWLDGHKQPCGDIDLRLSGSDEARLYTGQVGFSVAPRFRGRRLAARSLRLLLPLARRHGFTELWVTCNPENEASRRSIERAGGSYVDTVALPLGHALFEQGDRHKLRFRLDLGGPQPAG